MSRTPYWGRALPVGPLRRLIDRVGGDSLARETARLLAEAQGPDPLAGVASDVTALMATTSPLRAARDCIDALVASEAEAFRLDEGEASAEAGMALRLKARALIAFRPVARASVEAWCHDLVEIVRRVERSIASPVEGPIVTFDVPLIAIARGPAELVADLVRRSLAWTADSGELCPGSRTAARIAENLARASGLTVAEAGKRPERLIWPERSQPGTVLAERYLGGTPLYGLVMTPVPFGFGHREMAMSTHVMARTGAGKSAGALQTIIARLLDQHCSVVVIDNQGRDELLSRIERQRCFGPGGYREGRLIRIDPFDRERPIALNVFGMRGEGDDAEKAVNGAIDLLKFVFGQILAADMTSKQTLLFGFAARLLQRIEGATIHTLLEVLKHPQQFAAEIAGLDETAQAFFRDDFEGKAFRETREEVRRRILTLLEQPTFARMLSQPHGSIELARELQAGVVITVNTAKADLGTERSVVLGRLVVAMVWSAILSRANVPERQRTPTYLIIDEAFELMDASLQTFATQARKYKAGFVIAHQHLAQVRDPLLRRTLSSQMGVRLIGGVDTDDATTLSRELKVAPSLMTGLQAGSAERDAEFVLAVRGAAEAGVKIRMPMLLLDRAPQLSDAEYAAVCEDSRRRYGSAPAIPANGRPAKTVAKAGEPSAAPEAETSRWRSDEVAWDE